MKKLNEVSPIWHAVVWIVAYVLLVPVGDRLSELVGEPNSVTAPLLVVLAIVLIVYVSRNGWLRYYGVRSFRSGDFTKTLLYLPLLAIVLLQYAKGWREGLDLTAVLLIVALMVCVGFIEELVFRGFLFRAILTKSTLTRAIVISGVTFGIGHIVNLARGYTGVEQIIQIGFGVVLGIVLALLFAVTGTIVPLIIFHTLLNISGNVTAPDAGFDVIMLAITILISVGYAVYLVTVLRRKGPAPEMQLTLSPRADRSAHVR
ncbi:CPBP family intramembrane metalloprotease [Brooklawnia propionicigenes]|jgi:membrane protease YdiL (CAAX protease family)|uniref:CPBP family intramembrane metalloprotease n=1 Tax=Brooklawnia propionicigenes TaxID=3041175 RepID=A0AAN0MFL1_9ACTN|nr:CPBP family intramembrane glutamic endopeptidase [Brooklawnia sp. SH051]MEA5119833.1 CPBP family intramembrane glutamic endopeptidase [Propionibacterium sp.]BEH01469.1 CPBP family intramembrane metalloprotease [Brooklawnia sp. SH051]